MVYGDQIYESAQGGIRTPTPVKAPPPQDGVSTDSTTCAVKNGPQS